MEPIKAIANPIEVQAMQFTDSASGNAIAQWIAGFYPNLPMPTQVNFADDQPYSMMVQTKNGLVVCYLNDWVILGTEDEFYPCPADVFDTNYTVPSDG